MDSNLSNVVTCVRWVFMSSCVHHWRGWLLARWHTGCQTARTGRQAGRARQGGRLGRQAVSVGSCCYQTLHTTAQDRDCRAKKYRTCTCQQVPHYRCTVTYKYATSSALYLYLSRLKTRRLETAERRSIGNSRPIKYKRLGVRVPISMALYTRNDYIFNSNKSNGEERQRSRVYRFSSHII